jgi:hypothetical protein
MAVKDSVLKVVKSPAVRKAVVALVLAVLTALGISVGAGCGGAQLPARAAQAECVLGVLRDVGDPNALTLGQARQLAADLKACEPAPAGDAGAE